ncbi:hypothetical protein AGMMS49975_21520 [Clostridia bacterium]|nr:hypothetical protein AGMMS49975_21520 [Clostridia bacterium]
MLAALVGAIVLISKKQYTILDKIVLTLVVEAEKKYGAGTGAVKLAAVVDWLYPKIPAIIRLFITEKQIEQQIERVLTEAQKKWESNPNISTYIKS